MTEAGVPGVESETYYGLIAPAGLPADRIATLHAAMKTALQDPAIRKPLQTRAAAFVGNTPEEFASYIRAEAAKWGEVIRFSGAKLE
jgi:tripartite-type tricarboxylate transporter receptor subunit TctC